MARLTRLGWLAVGAALLTAAPASAAERPHKLRGTGQFVSATDFVGEGHATHLGHFDEVGSAQFLPTGEPGVLQVEGWAIHTASNGDQLFEVIAGQLNLLTGTGTATVTYVGGTGRFADAGGTATLSFQVFPDGTFAVAGKGTIDY
jgi:hypothetical protein